MRDEDVYEETSNDPSNLRNTIFTILNKIKTKGDLSAETLEYFCINDPKFARFYLLQKINKRLNDVFSRPVISNCGYYTEIFRHF